MSQVSKEGFVYKNTQGFYASVSETTTHTGTHVNLTWCRSIDNATVIPSVGYTSLPYFRRQAIKIERAAGQWVPVNTTYTIEESEQE